MGPFKAFHGVASSPLLHGDRLIVVQEDRAQPGGFIAAYDKKTGEQFWLTARSPKRGWNSPIAIRANGRNEILCSGSKEIAAYDPETGSELWRVPTQERWPLGMPRRMVWSCPR